MPEPVSVPKTGYIDGVWSCACGARDHYSCLCGDKTTDQYAELGEDDLIALLHDLCLGSAPEEVANVALALKARREATGPARKRIGEYLRQQLMYEATQTHREPRDELDSVRADQYAKAASLRLTDLRQVVEVRVWDSKAAFFRVQESRLAQWLESDEYKKLPPKQQALLPCVAKGHIERGYSDWRGTKDCCHAIHGATMNSLISKRHIVIPLAKVGFGHGHSILMLAEPKTS